MQQAIYPVQFSVDYPDRPLDRLTTFFRLVVAIPILIVLGSVSGGTWQWTTAGKATVVVAVGAGGLLFFAPLLLILFRQKYPRWWFDWNLELLRFSNRVGIYLALMDDRYPSTDEQQAVHLEYPYPDVARELNRWLPVHADAHRSLVSRDLLQRARCSGLTPGIHLSEEDIARRRRPAGLAHERAQLLGELFHLVGRRVRVALPAHDR